jgi:hypothetical protein
MPKFNSRYGPGSTVRVGGRSFPMPHTTEDPREIDLLSKAPGVFVVPAPPASPPRPPKEPESAPQEDPKPKPQHFPKEV